MVIYSHSIKIEIYGLKIKKNIFYEKCTIILDLNHGEDNWGNYNIFNIKQKIKSDNEIKDIIDNL